MNATHGADVKPVRADTINSMAQEPAMPTAREGARDALPKDSSRLEMMRR
jgi:hypothetical protein